MYHINEFRFYGNSPQAIAAYTSSSPPCGQAITRDGNAVRVRDKTRPAVEIVVSRPWAEGNISPLPLYSEDLSWAFR